MAKVKNQSNKKRYDNYKMSGRRLINKEKKAERHKKLMDKFAQRRAAKDDLVKEYTGTKENPTGSNRAEYTGETNVNSNRGRHTLLARTESVFAKLDYRMKKQMALEKVKLKEKKEKASVSA